MGDKHLHPLFLHAAIATYVYKTPRGWGVLIFFSLVLLNSRCFRDFYMFSSSQDGSQVLWWRTKYNWVVSVHRGLLENKPLCFFPRHELTAFSRIYIFTCMYAVTHTSLWRLCEKIPLQEGYGQVFLSSLEDGRLPDKDFIFIVVGCQRDHLSSPELIREEQKKDGLLPNGLGMLRAAQINQLDTRAIVCSSIHFHWVSEQKTPGVFPRHDPKLTAYTCFTF